MPDDESFFRDYVSKRQPVIITDLFNGQPIRQIRSLDDAKGAFGDVKLTIQGEYASTMATVRTTRTFNQYWDLVRENPSTPLLCTEHEIPAGVMTSFTLPSVCTRLDDDCQEILDFPKKFGDYDLLSNFFIANKGNKAHLHYDGDHRQVLLYQVFGRKGVFLFQPRSGVKLKPLDSPYYPSAGICLDQMTDDERTEFIGEANGYYGTLYPGEAIYMPMLIWHHLDYLDDGMSINIRFARNKFGRFLCVDNFHRDHYIQNFASELGGQTAVCPAAYRASVPSIIAEYLKPALNAFQKVTEMRKLFRTLCVRLCPDARIEEYCPPEFEEREVQRIIGDIGPKICYADPKTVVSSRLVGAISRSQQGQIQSKATSLGYSADLLSHLLLNRIGKPSVDALTKAEAAVFLTYLRSPGASSPAVA